MAKHFYWMFTILAGWYFLYSLRKATEFFVDFKRLLFCWFLYGTLSISIKKGIKSTNKSIIVNRSHSGFTNDLMVQNGGLRRKLWILSAITTAFSGAKIGFHLFRPNTVQLFKVWKVFNLVVKCVFAIEIDRIIPLNWMCDSNYRAKQIEWVNQFSTIKQ